MFNRFRTQLFLLAASGPLFLFAAFALLLFQASWDLWPFVLLSASGLVSTFLLQRMGFYCSFAALGALAIYQHSILLSQPLCALFLAGAILSWGIALLGQEEIASWEEGERQKKVGLEQEVVQLQEALEQAECEAILSPPDYSYAFKEALASRDAAIANQHLVYEEVEKLRQQCSSLSEEIVSYQNKEKALQAALEGAQDQIALLLKTKEEVNPVISQEEEPSQEIRLVEHQYALLKEQFDQKSEALNAARKELFRLEGEMTLFYKQEEEKRLAGLPEELAYQEQLQNLIKQCQDLEVQIQTQEEIISSMFLAKKVAKPKKPKAKKTSLPEVLQEAIDQKTGQYSLLD